MSLPKTFGVWGNIEKDAFWDILPEIIRWAENKNIECSSKITPEMVIEKIDELLV